MQLYGKGGEVLMSETSMVKAYCKYMKVLPIKTYPLQSVIIINCFSVQQNSYHGSPHTMYMRVSPFTEWTTGQSYFPFWTRFCI